MPGAITLKKYKQHVDQLVKLYGKTRRQVIRDADIFAELLGKMDKGELNYKHWCTSAINYYRLESCLPRFYYNKSKQEVLKKDENPEQVVQKRKESEARRMAKKIAKEREEEQKAIKRKGARGRPKKITHVLSPFSLAKRAGNKLQESSDEDVNELADGFPSMVITPGVTPVKRKRSTARGKKGGAKRPRGRPRKHPAKEDGNNGKNAGKEEQSMDTDGSYSGEVDDTHDPYPPNYPYPKGPTPEGKKAVWVHKWINPAWKTPDNYKKMERDYAKFLEEDDKMWKTLIAKKKEMDRKALKDATSSSNIKEKMACMA